MFLKGKVRVMPQKEGQDGQLEPNMRDPATIAFGFGRR